MSGAQPVIEVAGPWYEDLEVGQVYDRSPGLTLNEGLAALHQAIVGDRLRLALDAHLAARVIGPGPPLAHPGLVCDVAIGQSTLATQRVIANLFYRARISSRSPDRRHVAHQHRDRRAAGYLGPAGPSGCGACGAARANGRSG